MSSTSHPAATGPRLIFIDPIRIVLTVLVILHHVSITYGGGGSWYYKEPGAPEWTVRLLSIFTATNQSFFMGFFFLIAGYLMPASLDRKGPAAFLGDRLVRLWVPLFGFGYLLEPLTKALAIGAAGGDFLGELGERISHNGFGLGPLWFNQTLLIWTVLWVFAVRPDWTRRFPNPNFRPRVHASIALAVLGCGVLAFTLRLIVPVGQNVLGLQVGYAASYLILFFGGAWAAPRRLMERVEWRHALPWLVVSVISFPTLWIAAALRGLFGSPSWTGGAHVAALHYALWEPLVATGIIMTAVVAARRCCVREHPLVRRLAGASYGAFVVHAPVVVALSWLARSWSLSAFGHFLAVGILSSVVSFTIGIAMSTAFARRSPRSATVVAPLTTA